MTSVEWAIYVFLGIGLFFNFLASLGLMRFPDVYTRLHAGTKCTTFGSIFLSLAVIIYGLWKYYDGNKPMFGLAIHTLIAFIAIILTNPTGAHAIARAAHRSGVKPVQAVVDDLEEKEEKNDDD
ncbi:MAG: monovalent cation/H(+) antiporter subunit G [Candidatus Thermoplasmatota archaeon]|nr:monovalent cation/H(+) antiporter subunit G [Candidatus Thermoplasmatota archaeon]